MRMRTNGSQVAVQAVALTMSALMIGGCGGSSGTSDVAGAGDASRIAGDGASSSQQEAPPFRFSPTAHSPIYRETDPQPAHPSDFASLITRFSQCYGFEEKAVVPIASPSTASTGRSAAEPGGPKGSKKRSKERTSSKKPKRSSSEGALGASNQAGSTGAPPPSQAPAQPAQSARTEAAKSAPQSAAPMVAESAPDGAYEMEEAPAEAAYDADEDDNSPQRIAEGGETYDPSVPDPDMGYDDWGQATYLSNDDTMSLSSAQRILYAIDNFLPLPPEHIRPHELLNYFSFDTTEVKDGYDFSVNGDLTEDPNEAGIYTLGLAVRGRPVDKTSRRNAVLTLVVDRSGSMSAEGRMEYLKRGLLRMVDELKDGDMVNLVIFDHQVCVPMENFVVGRDPRSTLEESIRALTPRGSTDLHAGLSRGYALADAGYRTSSSNRVVLVTDALTNTGVTDEQMISMISKYYDSRRIRLSGVGVGRDFNDALLDRLTERGKGAYVFLGSDAEVDAVFGSRFISLIETTALDVHFRLHLPPSMRMNVFYGEESSTVKEDVQEIHYFANTSQLFLSDLMARGRQLRPQDDVMLTIEYKDPETEAALTEEYAFNLGNLLNRGRNAQKGRFIMAWVDLLAEMAASPKQYYGNYGEGTWQDEAGWQRCEEGRQMLSALSRGISDDPETVRVMQLFDKYCARFERPRHPVRRKIAAPEGSWPGAEAETR